MANEITVNVSLKVQNGNLVQQHSPGSLQFNQATALAIGGVQTIGNATHEALVLGTDVTTPGWTYMRNIDVSNHVSIGPVVSGTFYPVVHLEPGETCVYRMAPTFVPYAKAASGSVNLQYMIYAD